VTRSALALRALLLALLATGVTAACVLLPVLSHLFRFRAPTSIDGALAVLAGLFAVLAIDFAKGLSGVQRALGALPAGQRSAARSPLDLRQ